MSAYLSAVLADNPKHYWRLADPGGAVAQDIGSVYKPEFSSQNSIAMPYTGPVSDGGSALCNSNVAFWNLDAENNSTPASVDFWCWIPYTRGVASSLFDAETATQSLLLLLLQTNNALQLNAGAGHFTAASPITPAVWHHVAATRDASTATLYLDGASIGSFAAAAVASTGVNFAIGQSTGGASQTTAFIAEVAFYQSALSSARVAAHHSAADQSNLAPVYRSNGILDVTTGAFTADTDLLSQILASVRKTFPTT